MNTIYLRPEMRDCGSCLKGFALELFCDVFYATRYKMEDLMHSPLTVGSYVFSIAIFQEI